MSDKSDAIDMLRDALDMLREVNDTLRQANRIIKDTHAEAYLLVPLRIMTDTDHGYLSSDYNLEQWIADLEKGKLDDEPDDETLAALEETDMLHALRQGDEGAE